MSNVVIKSNDKFSHLAPYKGMVEVHLPRIGRILLVTVVLVNDFRRRPVDLHLSLQP